MGDGTGNLCGISSAFVEPGSQLVGNLSALLDMSYQPVMKETLSLFIPFSVWIRACLRYMCVLRKDTDQKILRLVEASAMAVLVSVTSIEGQGDRAGVHTDVVHVVHRHVLRMPHDNLGWNDVASRQGVWTSLSTLCRLLFP